MSNQSKEIVLDSNSILTSQLARSFGLEKYSRIMSLWNSDRFDDFVKEFTRYYQLRRNKEWRIHFFKLFIEARDNSYSFDRILTRLYEMTHRVEASFSSKMLATIDASMPIMDRHVLHYFDLNLGGESPEEKLSNAVNVYNQIVGLYREYLKTEEAEKTIESFDRMIPEYTWINPTKKIDYLIWSKR